MIIRFLKALFVCPNLILMLLGGISVIALVSAFTSQYAFGLMPCELCIYQRIPYAVVILLSVMGVWATKIMDAKYGAFNLALCAVAFLVNSGIAFYHVGVEQHWWTSGCTFGDVTQLNIIDLVSSINNAPTVSCDQIPWTLFGISMAGYNVFLCAILGIYSAITSVTVIKHANKIK